MKKWIDHIAKRVFTVSGFVTSAIILLIIGFLFTEAVGLFNNPIVEDGYTLVVNKENPIKSLSSQQIKDLILKIRFISKMKNIMCFLWVVEEAYLTLAKTL